ncbi:MAG: ATP-binding protein [Lachnospiraceae bacterium]|nr:ATP-binding protein [Lachnospiraceae bacterium]
MFVGREEQLGMLNKIYSTNSFEFLVLYGQRRIGKTTLLGEFIRTKEAIFFTAKEANDKMNLQGFTDCIIDFFKLASGISFKSWQDAFEFIAKESGGKKTIIVFDEYPYAALANKSLNSMLQIAIDHTLKNTSIKLILSGSHVSFMENDVLGNKSPLYGRRTRAIQLKQFDYYEAGLMLEEYSSIDKIQFYSVLGGVPYYISLVDKSLTFEENLVDMFFRIDGKLFDEPFFLMREEFKEPATYNSIIMAIAKGANRPHDIQQVTGIDSNSTPFYLKQLLDIGFIRKVIPFGENPLKSKKGIYEIADNTFRFWYQYAYPNKSSIELGFGDVIAQTKVLPYLDDFIGKTVFESVSQQYLVRASQKRLLPFTPTGIGKWWGNDKQEKKETDIDVILESDKEVVLGECKWRESFPEIQDIDNLLDKKRLLPRYEKHHYAFFSKHPLSKKSSKYLRDAVKNPTYQISTDDLFHKMINY